MDNSSIYHVENGNCYILVEEESVGRERQNLLLAIKMAKVEIFIIRDAMDRLDDDTEEYDQLQEALNDHEMLVSDFGDRIIDLQNRPTRPKM